jgi:hypothetical protein
MKGRARVTGEITKGECTSPECPVFPMPHRHEIEGTFLKVHPEDYADKVRAAGLSIDLWGGEDD